MFLTGPVQRSKRLQVRCCKSARDKWLHLPPSACGSSVGFSLPLQSAQLTGLPRGVMHVVVSCIALPTLAHCLCLDQGQKFCCLLLLPIQVGLHWGTVNNN